MERIPRQKSREVTTKCVTMIRTSNLIQKSPSGYHREAEMLDTANGSITVL